MYKYTNEDGVEVSVSNFETGKAYCLPDACEGEDCVVWCGPDLGGNPLDLSFTKGFGGFFPTGVSCGDNGLEFPVWSEIACTIEKEDIFEFEGSL